MSDEGSGNNPSSSNPPEVSRRSRAHAAPGVWHDAYLEAFGLTGHVEMSARAAGVESSTVRRARRSAAFAEAEQEAKARAAAALQLEARRRAVEGWEEPVYGMVHGETKRVGTIRRYSDGLLTLLLKGLAPETYRENLKVTGALSLEPAPVSDDPVLLEAAATFLALAFDPENSAETPQLDPAIRALLLKGAGRC